MNRSRDPSRVQVMFDRLAPRYDMANTVLSLGRDAAWRRAAAAQVQRGDHVLDVACGTGRLAAALQQRVAPGGRVTGLDFSAAMLHVARSRYPDIRWVRGDAASLPFDDATFDAATIAFGLRNLAQPDGGLREMRRVVRPSGRLVVLEFLRPPPDLVGRTYSIYLRRVLPRLGGRLTGQPGAYRYLSDTVGGYLTPEELTALVRTAGWGDVRLRRLNLGTVALLVARGTRAAA